MCILLLPSCYRCWRANERNSSTLFQDSRCQCLVFACHQQPYKYWDHNLRPKLLGLALIWRLLLMLLPLLIIGIYTDRESLVQADSCKVAATLTLSRRQCNDNITVGVNLKTTGFGETFAAFASGCYSVCVGVGVGVGVGGANWQRRRRTFQRMSNFSSPNCREL